MTINTNLRNNVILLHKKIKPHDALNVLIAIGMFVLWLISVVNYNDSSFAT